MIRLRCIDRRGPLRPDVMLPLLLLTLCLLLPLAAVEAEAVHLLILDGAGEEAPLEKDVVSPPPPLRPATRHRQVTPNPVLGEVGALAKGDGIRLNLFPDVQLEARLEIAEALAVGITTVRARLQAYPLGFLVATQNNGVLKVSIEIPELAQYYQILHDPKSRAYQLLERDMTALDFLELCTKEALIPDWPPPNLPALRDKAHLEGLPDLPGPEEPATIRVMALYTPAARAWTGDAAGESANINNTIAQAMARANLTADNSAVGLHFELAHTAEVDYQESGDSVKDLKRLTFYEGFDPFDMEAGPPWYMDEIHDWRDAHCADLVVLLSRASDVGGIAWLLTEEEGIPELGFSITRVQQAGLSFTMTHEMAHNMGAHHHKAQNSQPGPGLFPYAAGWRWVGSDNGRYASVMTYESGGFFNDGRTHFRVAHFSNPEVAHLGAATGHVLDGDNARTIRAVKHAVAAYRGDCNAPDLSIRSNIPPDEIRVGDALALTAGDNGAEYLWYKDGMLLEDDERISGVESQFLQIAPILPEDAGAYTVTFVFAGEPVTSETFEIPAVLEALPITQYRTLAALVSVFLYLGYRTLRRRMTPRPIL